MKRDELDDILKRKLQNFDAGDAVPAWSAMERRLILSENEAAVPPTRRFRLSAWTRYSAAALVVLVMGLGIFRISDRSKQMVQQITTDSLVEELPLLKNAVTADMLADSEAERNPIVSKLVKNAQYVAVVQPVNKPDALQPERDRLMAVEAERKIQDATGSSGVTNQSLPTGSSSPAVGSRARNQAEQPKFKGFDWGNDKSNRKNRKSWLASVSATSAASSRNGTGGMVKPGPFHSPVRASAFLSETSFMKNTIGYAGANLNHEFPVSVGLSVRKQITDRLSLGTGLNYTYMRSAADLKGEFEYKYDQRLHYLGIPLTVNYSIFQNKNFDFYLFGGIMAEKAISAKGTTKVYSQGVYSSSLTDNLPTGGLLWSANAGLGLGYDLVDNFGIYVAPGVNYYLPNQNQPASYRTDNPWSFNVAVGFRFKF